MPKQFNFNIINIIVFEVSERDVQPKVAAPSWNRSQAANEKLEKKVEEEQSLASSNDERHQAVSNESLDHLAGVFKGNSRTTMNN